MGTPELTLETGQGQRSRIRDLGELQRFVLDWFIEAKRWDRDVFGTQTLWHLAPSHKAATARPKGSWERGDTYTDVDGTSWEWVYSNDGWEWKEIVDPFPGQVWRRSAKFQEMADMVVYFVRESVKDKDGTQGDDWANWGAWYVEGKTSAELRHFFEFVEAAWDDWYEVEYPDASVHLAEEDHRDQPAI